MTSTLAFVAVVVLVALTTTSAQDYTQAALTAHNNVRNKHQNTGPLSLSNELNGKAEKCAKRNADRGSLKHDCPEQKGYGENLAMNSRPANCQEAVKNAVDMWYAEKKDYNYNKPGFSQKTGHFTQVVWKGSSQVGCGCVKSNKGYWTSCLYSPSGNSGNYEQNVQREK